MVSRSGSIRAAARSIDDEYPLCIRDFAAFGLKTSSIFLNKKAKEKLAAILSETNLTKIADRPLGRASGGEKQRAYLAQALCADPKLLIFDEATASLDQTSKHELLKMLRNVMKEHGLTIMFITHDPELIAAYATTNCIWQTNRENSSKRGTRNDAPI